jgi:hypothetical protein
VTIFWSARVHADRWRRGDVTVGVGPGSGSCSTVGVPAGSTGTTGMRQRCRRTTVRECEGSGFDSAATALLTCSTPRTTAVKIAGQDGLHPSDLRVSRG